MLSETLTWFEANETVLSGIAAAVVVLSIAGAAMRGALARGATSFVGALRSRQKDHDIDVSQPVPGFGGRAAIAVLPFDNMSDDPEQEYFADGIAEDILTSLQAFRSFPVIARNSTFNYKGTSPDVRKVAKELGAGYVLEGSVRKVGDRVRITGQLIDAAGHHLWAGKYDKDLSDIFTVQDEITSEIIGAIAPEIERADITLAARKRAKDMTAWDYLLQAQVQFHKLTPDSIRKSRELADKAIERDPEFATALIFLARAHISNGVFFNGLALEESAEESLLKAEECARKAVTLDKSLGYAHAIVGLCFFFRRQHDRALEETTTAMSINPSEPIIRAYYALALWANGDADAALAELQVAKRLSPNASNLWFTLHAEAMILAFSGRYEEAVVAARKAIEERAGATLGHMGLIIALDALGLADEAKNAFQKAIQDVPGFSPPLVIMGIDDEETREGVYEACRRAGWDG